jgi:predicted Zn finger-like uncharacterized protein
LLVILTCPACGTQYVVKDGAIPEGGRKVRCASCRHSWHQDPPPLELEEPLDEAAAAADSPDAAAPREDSTDYPPPISEETGYAEAPEPPGDHLPEPAEATVEATAPPADDLAEASDYAPTESEPAYEAPPVPIEGGYADLRPPEDVDDDFSPFAARDPIEGKKRSPLIALLLVIVLVAALAALFWFLAPPEWKARVGLAEVGQTPLQLMMTHSDRQALASGNELLAVSGRVINPTAKSQRVPPIQAELRSKSGQVVYRWTIAPPTATLAPGASAPFNSAEVNVPAGGEELTVSLGAPGA